MVSISVYGVVGEGLAGNTEVLQELFKFIHGLRHGAWLVGGDWNLLPQEIAEYDLTRASGGRVIAPGKEYGREIDFFLAGPAVQADWIEAVQFEETLLPTHDAVRLTLRGPVRLPRVAAVLKPKSPWTGPQLEAMRDVICAGGAAGLERFLGHAGSEAAREAASALAALPGRWAEAGADARQALREWNRSAEAYIWAASTGVKEIPPGGAGRGDEVKVAWRTLRPKVDKTTGADHGAAAARWATTGRRLARLADITATTRPDMGPERANLLARLRRTILQGRLGTEFFDEGWASFVARLAAAGADELRAFAEMASATAQELVRRRRARDEREWAQWCLRALQAGASAACAFARDERPMETAAAEVDGRTLFDPQGVAEVALEAWAGVWGRTGPPHDPTAIHAAREWLSRPGLEQLSSAPLPPLTGDALRKAACSQKGRGCGLDHWTREEVRALPKEAYQALAEVYRLVEDEGAFPPEGRGTIEVLLSKGKGDAALLQRNLGLLPRLYRIWVAARQPEVRQWSRESGHDWSWGSGSGRGSPDAAWQAAFQAETALARGRSYGGVLYDCRQCYERVPLSVAAGSSAKALFPARLARVALAQYAAPRAVRTAGAISSWQSCPGGLVAGCGFAGYILRCVLSGPVAEVQRDAPDAAVRVVADDCHISAEGSAPAVARALAAATAAWKRGIEDTGGELNVDKTVALVNRPPARRAVAAGLAEFGVRTASAARDLGVDAAAAARRSTAVQANRVRTMKAKASRFAIIKGPPRLKRLPARAVLVTGGLYGAAVVGMAAGELRKLRVAVATAIGGRPKGRRCLTAYLAVIGATDPAITLAETTIEHWARAVWSGDVSDEAVGPAWRRSTRKIRSGCLAAAWVRGPVAATIRVVLGLGWKPEAPTKWRLPDGSVLDLTVATPRRARDAAGRAAAVAAWRAGAVSRRDAAGSEEGVDLTNFARASRGADAKRVGALTAIASGAVTTPERRWRQGYQDSPACEECGAASADEVHFFWKCPAGRAPRQKAGFTDEIVDQLVACAPACFLTRGLVPHRWTARRQAAGPCAWGGEPAAADDHCWPYLRTLAGTVATDGAARRPTDARRRRAAWGFYSVALDRTLCGPLPGAAPTVLRAELWALLEVFRRAAPVGDLLLLVDNLIAVNGLGDLIRAGPGKAPWLTGPQCQDADLWRAIADEIAGLPGLAMRVRWVPSHLRDADADPQKAQAKLDKARAQDGWDESWLDHNDRADRAARRGLELNPGEPDELEQDAAVEATDAWTTAALGFMADLVLRAATSQPRRRHRTAWRGPTGRPPGRPRVVWEPGGGPTKGGHRIEQAAGAWRCTLCGRMAVTAGSKRFLRYTRCRVGGGAAAAE